jgi:hypothetical protein
MNEEILNDEKNEVVVVNDIDANQVLLGILQSTCNVLKGYNCMYERAPEEFKGLVMNIPQYVADESSLFQKLLCIIDGDTGVIEKERNMLLVKWIQSAVLYCNMNGVRVPSYTSEYDDIVKSLDDTSVRNNYRVFPMSEMLHGVIINIICNYQQAVLEILAGSKNKVPENLLSLRGKFLAAIAWIKLQYDKEAGENKWNDIYSARISVIHE